MRPVTSIESVTAGLKWPPEMCPTAVTISPIASPFASACPTRSAPCSAEPAPKKISANVPTNSAASLRWLSSIRPPLSNPPARRPARG